MSSVFITGNSQGLGLGLTSHFLHQGDKVYSVSRSPCPLDDEHLNHREYDLSEFSGVPDLLSELITENLDLAILNAGILGHIDDLANTSLETVQHIMNVNVWANKMIIDWLINNSIECKQLILMSSGASVNGNRGWGAYSISKASLNMMAKLYAHEMPASHITALAPGLIHTQMQEYLCQQVDRDLYPSINNLFNAMHTDVMPDIDEAARRIANALHRCLDYPSGSFVDIRQLD